MSRFHTVRPPSEECPKCGDPRGFADSMPRYDHGPDVSGFGYGLPFADWIRWECRSCGYEVRTKPVDREAVSA